MNVIGNEGGNHLVLLPADFLLSTLLALCLQVKKWDDQ
jgi:hypothetical protein